MKAGRSEGPKNQETDQLKELWKAEREVSRNSLGASEERTTQTGREGRVKQWILLEGTERWEASPHQAKYSAEGLNEMPWGTTAERSGLNLLPGSTAGCGKPHVRWCGRVTARNRRDPTRSYPFNATG